MGTPSRMLALVRHATAEPVRPGHGDRARRLTPDGVREAELAGAWLGSRLVGPVRILSSPAVRAWQTAEALGLDADLREEERLYEAGGETVQDVVRAVPDEVRALVVVGHAPAVPWLVRELADPSLSDGAALAGVGYRFPPATVAVLVVDGPWRDLESGRLLEARLP